MSEIKSVILAGVGGQGILLAGNILARAALLAGHDVKTNEVHGMAQRGGSVVAEIRYGEKVRSPLVEPGTACALGSLEQMEALRYAHVLAPGALAVVSKTRIVPTTVSSGAGKYPDDIGDRLGRAFSNLRFIDAAAAAGKAGNPRSNNLVVLGALSMGLDFPEALWEKAIGECVKARFVGMNIVAFNLGREMAEA
ncbi:MAG: indolepyruvate oxidoreductase subunit beta [Planctomycetota bacterium]|jgi:indolepyruvate ferredoxin oxidoreductase beta subunit|nr:indolepyruvate oxidoreductase subunit beta [Planctomycetota bacterium]